MNASKCRRGAGCWDATGPRKGIIACVPQREDRSAATTSTLALAFLAAASSAVVARLFAATVAQAICRACGTSKRPTLLISLIVLTRARCISHSRTTRDPFATLHLISFLPLVVCQWPFPATILPCFSPPVLSNLENLIIAGIPCSGTGRYEGTWQIRHVLPHPLPRCVRFQSIDATVEAAKLDMHIPPVHAHSEG